jgi:Zn-dependent protease with chaperone function
MALTAGRYAPADDRDDRTAPQPTGSYKVRAFLLSLLGYAYIFGILALALALIGLLVLTFARFRHGGAVLVKLALPLGGLALVILRSLWIRFSPPSGRQLTLQDAPVLFAAVDELRAELSSPAVDRVLLTDDLNAAVARVPRLGIFGFHRTYLLVGLPLLQALSPEQFRAVLAHELGHLADKDGHLGAWIYRTRITWEKLLVRLLVEDHWGKYIFLPFFRWYSPFFSRYSFALAQAQEYQADHAAAVAAGARQAADALLTVEIQGEYLQRHYWPELFERIKH